MLEFVVADVNGIDIIIVVPKRDAALLRVKFSVSFRALHLVIASFPKYKEGTYLEVPHARVLWRVTQKRFQQLGADATYS